MVTQASLWQREPGQGSRVASAGCERLLSLAGSFGGTAVVVYLQSEAEHWPTGVPTGIPATAFWDTSFPRLCLRGSHSWLRCLIARKLSAVSLFCYFIVAVGYGIFRGVILSGEELELWPGLVTVFSHILLMGKG